MNLIDKIHKEISEELLAMQDMFNCTGAEFAGILLGAGVTIAQKAGISKAGIIVIVSNLYKDNSCPKCGGNRQIIEGNYKTGKRIVTCWGCGKVLTNDK